MILIRVIIMMLCQPAEGMTKKNPLYPTPATFILHVAINQFNKIIITSLTSSQKPALFTPSPGLNALFAPFNGPFPMRVHPRYTHMYSSLFS